MEIIIKIIIYTYILHKSIETKYQNYHTKINNFEINSVENNKKFK